MQGVEQEDANIVMIDIVKYSDLPVSGQLSAIKRLTEVVRNSSAIQETSSDRVFFLPTGDGMVVGFLGFPALPFKLACEIHRQYNNDRKTLKMGIHAGYVIKYSDINGNKNYAGSSINMAQRVESCCQGGHILLAAPSKVQLQDFDEWANWLHGPYTVEVKGGKEIQIFNFYNETEKIGNPEEPVSQRKMFDSERLDRIDQSVDLKFENLLENTYLKLTGPHQIYQTFREAIRDIVNACKDAQKIRIFANRGLVFLGTDDSIVSTAEINSYKNLSKIQILLMSPDSHWIGQGFIGLRKHESREVYLDNLKASHIIVENAMRRFSHRLSNTRSGVKYFTGEPCWRLIMTDKTVFVSSYADDKDIQVRDLPVCRFDNQYNSFYSAFKRHFNNIWHNESKPGSFMQTQIDFTVSAGGIVYADVKNKGFVLLLRRHDGYLVLPKGHKKHSDNSLEAVAIREVSEETGLMKSCLKIIKKIDIYSDTTYEDEHKIVHIFLIQYIKDEFDLPIVNSDIEHAEALWCPIENALEKELSQMLYPYQRIYLAEFAEEYVKKSLNKG